MVSLTDQEWILVFSVMTAMIIFIAAVFCIVYALLCVLRDEDEYIDVREVRTVKCDPAQVPPWAPSQTLPPASIRPRAPKEDKRIVQYVSATDEDSYALTPFETSPPTREVILTITAA